MTSDEIWEESVKGEWLKGCYSIYEWDGHFHVMRRSFGVHAVTPTREAAEAAMRLLEM